MTFDADTGALQERLAAYKSTAHNLEDWILEQVQIKPGMRILDLGCGTGKQIFFLRETFDDLEVVEGTDVSEQAVALVNETAAARGYENVRARVSAHDEVVQALAGERFDLIISTYSIYYAKDLQALLIGLRELLKPGGSVFVVGPGEGTNHELHSLLNGLAPDAERGDSVADFIGPEMVAEVTKHYDSHSVRRLHNEVSFDEVDVLMGWWENHNSYVAAARAQVADAVQAQIEVEQRFKLTKNVLGVQFGLQ